MRAQPRCWRRRSRSGGGPSGTQRSDECAAPLTRTSVRLDAVGSETRANCTVRIRLGTVFWSALDACAACYAVLTRAKVAELADAPDLGSGSRKAMGVRVPPFALLRSRRQSAHCEGGPPDSKIVSR